MATVFRATGSLRVEALVDGSDRCFTVGPEDAHDHELQVGQIAVVGHLWVAEWAGKLAERHTPTVVRHARGRRLVASAVRTYQ